MNDPHETFYLTDEEVSILTLWRKVCPTPIRPGQLTFGKSIQPTGTHIRSSAEAASFLSDMKELAQEQMRVLVLNYKNTLLGQILLYQGGVGQISDVRPADVYRDAVAMGAPCVLIAHCHPSGDPEPSGADSAVTRELSKAGELLGITLLDHLVIAREGWRSLRQMGLYRPKEEFEFKVAEEQ